MEDQLKRRAHEITHDIYVRLNDPRWNWNDNMAFIETQLLRFGTYTKDLMIDKLHDALGERAKKGIT